MPRFDLLEDSRQVLEQIFNQVIKVKQVCKDDIWFQEEDPFRRCSFFCLFQFPVKFTIRGPVLHVEILVSIDTFVNEVNLWGRE